jgi:hypothetical protein
MVTMFVILVGQELGYPVNKRRMHAVVEPDSELRQRLIGSKCNAFVLRPGDVSFLL